MVDGKRRQRSTRKSTLAEAAPIAERALDAALARARGEEPEPTLRELVVLWLDAHTLEKSPARVRSIETFGRLHYGPLLDLPLREITPKRVQDARNLYLHDHARTSANTWRNCLRTLFGWAVAMRMIREVPWRLAKLKVKRKPKVLLPIALADEWLETVDRLAAHDPGIGLVIRICFTLGLRVGEAISARWEWLDTDRCTYTPGDTKGGEAFERPVPPELLEKLHPPTVPVGFMVPSRPGHPITDKRVRYLIKLANKACGVFKVTPHRLRGTYATLLSESGTPIQDIQRALGHRDVRTTVGYLEVDLGRIARGQAEIARRRKVGRKFGTRPDLEPHQDELCEFSGEIGKSEVAPGLEPARGGAQ
jgi:integrase